MISGTVDVRLYATIPLTVIGPTGRTQDITAAIDAGYNGARTLPRATAAALALARLAPKAVTLGDASQKVLSFFRADVLWDGQRRTVRVLCVEADPLVGTALLRGYRLGVDFVAGGAVAITTLP